NRLDGFYSLLLLRCFLSCRRILHLVREACRQASTARLATARTEDVDDCESTGKLMHHIAWCTKDSVVTRARRRGLQRGGSDPRQRNFRRRPAHSNRVIRSGEG